MDRLDALRLFLEVSEVGSFSAVARRRAIATSTVALAVTQLEDEFRTRLMTRTTRQLVFTHEGMRLLNDARRIVSEWDAAIGETRDGGALAGPIRVTATNDFGRTQLRRLLDGFQTLHPAVQISLLLTDNVVDLLEERVDVALRYGPLADSTLKARLLIRGYRYVCASPSYWARAGKPEHPNDLANHNCLVLARPGNPLAVWPFRDDKKQFSVKVKGDRQASDGAVLREWAVDGIGVVVKNGWDIRHEVKAGKLEVALEGFNASQVDLFAVQPAGLPSRRSAVLVDYLAQELSNGRNQEFS